MKIYFDLDGVMANFEKGVVEQTGVHYWDRTDKTEKAKYWPLLDKIPNFYYHLEPIEGSLEMFHAVMDKYGTDVVEVLTGLPKPTGEFISAHDDKVNWVHEHMHPTIKVNTIVGGKNKYKYLDDEPGALLIDDYLRNVKSWVDCGGVGILHTDPASTIAKLKLLKVID